MVAGSWFARQNSYGSYGAGNLLDTAKRDWFSLGDKNTRLFHLAATIRKQKYIYRNFSMRIAFGGTTNLTFYRSFIKNFIANSRRIITCILNKLSLYLKMSKMQTMHTYSKMLLKMRFVKLSFNLVIWKLHVLMACTLSFFKNVDLSLVRTLLVNFVNKRYMLQDLNMTYIFLIPKTDNR